MIRYNKGLNDKITKAVRNYNAKIRRLEKINPYLALPERVTVSGIKKKADTRRDVERTLKSLQRFSKRGAENTVMLPSGEMISSYELNELKRESARLQRNLTRRINKLAAIKPKVAGIEQDYTYAEMGDMRLNNMIAKRNALRNFKLTSGEDLSKYTKLIETTRNKQNYQINVFKNNYLDKMLFAEAYMIGYDQNKINVIKEKLSTLSNKDFLSAFDNEKLFQMVRDLYPKASSAGDYFVFEEQLTDVYDELYNNIDDIIKTYSSA